MADYIKREDALHELQVCQNVWGNDFSKTFSLAAEKFLKSIPAADVAPVVHGRWEYSGTTADSFDLVKCTRCGFEPYAISHFVREGNFCPNCGADMRKKGADPHE